MFFIFADLLLINYNDSSNNNVSVSANFPLDNATLLGAPVVASQALNDSLSAMCGDLEVTVERLQLIIFTDDALFLLKSCLG